jgi:hypothetical protein
MSDGLFAVEATRTSPPSPIDAEAWERNRARPARPLVVPAVAPDSLGPRIEYRTALRRSGRGSETAVPASRCDVPHPGYNPRHTGQFRNVGFGDPVRRPSSGGGAFSRFSPRWRASCPVRLGGVPFFPATSTRWSCWG